MRTWMDRVSEYARAKFGLPEGWSAYYFAVPPKGSAGLVIHGAIPRPLKRGPRKGKMTWRDKECFAVFTLNGSDLESIDKNKTGVQLATNTPWIWLQAQPTLE